MKANYPLEAILKAVCDYYQVDKSQIISVNRHNFLVRPRQMYFYMASEFSVTTSIKKADFIDRDHATALYSMNKIRIEKEIYPDIRKEIEGITAMLFNTSKLIVENINLLELTENYTRSFING